MQEEGRDRLAVRRELPSKQRSSHCVGLFEGIPIELRLGFADIDKVRIAPARHLWLLSELADIIDKCELGSVGMDVVMVWPQSPVPLRPQYRLRTLFLCILALCAFLGVLAANIHAYRDQERLIAEFRAHGAHIFYRHEIDNSSEPPGPGALRQLLGANFFGNITYLSLYEYDQPVTDAMLEIAAQFEDLEDLSLDDTNINDDQLRYLCRLTKLKDLDLAGTRITDAGLGHLHGLTNLENVWLNETRVTADGIRKLRHALPNAEIHWKGFHIHVGII